MADELFAVTGLLDDNAALRRSVADPSREGKDRSDLVTRLQAALRAVDVGYYVDHDEQYVVYEPWDSATASLMRATYDQSPIPTLGTPEPVTRTVTYNPTTADAGPADAATPATESQEDTMAKTEIDEQELRQLRESASRAETLAQENTALKEAAEAAAAAEAEAAEAEGESAEAESEASEDAE